MESPLPVQQHDRLIVVDILRGIAVLGILIVNMSMINTPFFYLQFAGIDMWTSLWDEWVEAFIYVFAQGKFYTLFSFLFGLGFILFMERAEFKVRYPALLYLRRLIVLLGFGLIHAYLIWWGDILVTYALGGLLLLAFYKVKPKTLIIWAVLLQTTYLCIIGLNVGLTSLVEKANPGILAAEYQAVINDYKYRIEGSMHAYGEGTFAEIMNQRIQDFHFSMASWETAVFTVLPMFLLGIYAGRIKIFQQIQDYSSLIRKIWIWSFTVGFGLNLLKLWSTEKIDPLLPSIYNTYQALGMTVGDTAMSLFYIASIVLLTKQVRWRERLKPFANVGRMAISNYLFQSVLCTTLYYSYGFGLYGQVGPLLGLILALFIFAFQLYASRLWLQRYHFGPVEWLWRTLTYGRLQKFKKS
jgi:uncharacterized protein